MTKSTHVGVGIAASVWMLHPSTPNQLILAMLTGAVGASLPDIDVKKSRSKVDNFFPKEAVAIAVVALIIADRYFRFGITESIEAEPFSQLSGAILLLAYFVIGFYSPHRSFTHSIFGAMIAGAGVLMISQDAIYPFVIGYASHILIDLLNRKNEKIFYPFGKGICFKICSSNGIVNKALQAGSTLVILAYFLVLGK